ncbi:MAG: long-chain fatty acid--CoA ligase [Parachlamydiaceae bacterium]|nr:long-chain fatty acid--CoA ligase [Parachlamydiaceae bacterium]
MNKLHTCVDLLNHIESSESNSKALNYRDSEGWHAISSQSMLDSVKHLSLGLHQLGLQKGDRVGILAHSSPNWTIADLAILAAGGVTVTIFANISDENFVYQVIETKLRIIFFDDAETWKACLLNQGLFDIAIDMHNYSSNYGSGNSPQHEKIITLANLIEQGKALEVKRPGLYNQIKATIKPEDLAVIIYTSGSTGVPKGVEVTQSSLSAVLHFDKFDLNSKKDSYLCVLPLAHVFGHCTNMWALAWGISIYYTNDYKNLGAICREIQPTTMVVVPRLMEKVYNRMVENVHSASFIKRMIGHWAFAMAKKEKGSFFKSLFKGVADKLVYSKLRDALGGKLHTVICGGAALNPHLHNFFENIGVPIYEGWGLTEACPLCINLPKKNKIGTVGPPILEHKIMISPEGEVLVKGPLIMRGYYCKPDITAKTLDQEGWMHTGDRGTIDSDNYLTLKGRMKELYKTSTGEYVAPVPIEQALTRNPLIDMAMVVAEGRKFTSCLIFPNFDAIARLKGQKRLQNMRDEEFLNSSAMEKEMQKFMLHINQHLNRAEQIHAYRFIMDPLSIEGGELTPSMKIRREIVAEKYSDVINAIYPQEET